MQINSTWYQSGSQQISSERSHVMSVIAKPLNLMLMKNLSGRSCFSPKPKRYCNQLIFFLKVASHTFMKFPLSADLDDRWQKVADLELLIKGIANKKDDNFSKCIWSNLTSLRDNSPQKHERCHSQHIIHCQQVGFHCHRIIVSLSAYQCGWVSFHCPYKIFVQSLGHHPYVSRNPQPSSRISRKSSVIFWLS